MFPGTIQKIQIKGGSAFYALSTSERMVGNSYDLYFFKHNNGTVDSENSKNMPNYSRKLIYDELNKIQNEIKQNTPKPKVNLQWIWNIWFRIHYR